MPDWGPSGPDCMELPIIWEDMEPWEPGPEPPCMRSRPKGYGNWPPWGLRSDPL